MSISERKIKPIKTSLLLRQLADQIDYSGHLDFAVVIIDDDCDVLRAICAEDDFFMLQGASLDTATTLREINNE